MEVNLKKLPIEFIGKGEVKGFQFRQLIRGQKACIYYTYAVNQIHFEVFKIKIGRVPKTDELYEQYPKANSFGIWAWTHRSYENALVTFNKIENNE